MSLDRELREICSVFPYPESAIKTIKQAFKDAGWTPPAKVHPEAERIIEAFKEANNVPSVRPTDIKAARLLAEKYGADNIIQIIQIMAAAQGKPYVPSINNIKNLQDKWVMVGNYIKKNQEKDYGF